MKAPNAQRILLVDLGSQFTQKVAIIVRHFQVYSEILPYDCQWEKVTSFQPTGVIFYGDLPENAQAAKAKIDARFFDLGVPLLGIGYGMQVIVEQLGGKVEYLDNRNPTEARVQVSATHNWLTGINDGVTAEQGEYLDLQICSTIRIAQLPEGFTPVAQTPTTIVAIENSNKRYYGHLFHTDSSRSNKGQDIVYRFITDICGCARTWSAANIVEYSVANIREQVGQDHVLLGLSGGVDSSVVAALLHKAIGAQLTCVFVDNGLLRLNEGKQVMETFANHMGVRVIHVNAEERFLSALAGVDDPEQKRKIIGHTFIDIFDEEAAKLSDVKWLAQGTIYSDVIESIGAGGDEAKFVKSHHNVGGLPENMQLKLLEPLRNLFKDDVRKIGAELGLPLQMINRHPFPGPGIGVRILGAVNKSFADILRQADHIFIDELYQSDLYGKVSQAFAVFLPIKSVGVANDERRYDFVIALRAVETIDFMTARWAHLPYELLDKVSQRIINEVDGVSRVVYDISGKPPATIEWE